MYLDPKMKLFGIVATAVKFDCFPFLYLQHYSLLITISFSD